MTSSSRPERLIVVALVVALAVAVGGYFVWRRTRVPAPGSPTYERMVRSFYHGLASLQVGLLDDAKGQFAQGTVLVPREPAAWANLGLADLRLGDFDAASDAIARAAALAPTNSDIALLEGRLETARGRLDDAIARFRRAVDLNPGSLRARYALAEQIESSGSPGADADAQRLFNELFSLRPGNLAVLLERARLAAKRSDSALLGESIDRLKDREPGWPDVAREQFAELQHAAAAANFQDAARDLAVLRNVLVRVPAYRESLAEIRTPTELLAEPFERFLRLQAPTAAPSALDERLSYTTEPDPFASSSVTALLATPMDGTAAPAVFAIRGDRLIRLGAGASESLMRVGPFADRSASTMVALDWNRDYKMDVAIAGRGGVQLLLQDDNGALADATAKASAHAPFVADCSGVWAADIEMDGDLDLIVGVENDAPVVLRNNGDGTWQPVRPFADVVGVRAFAWGDLDGDGDPDAAVVDARGQLHVFANRQGGQFQQMAAPRAATAVALAIGDVNGDGVLDLVTLDASGVIHRASFGDRGWDESQMATWGDAPRGAEPGAFRLMLADLDNNGALDVVVSGAGRSAVWLGGAGGQLRALSPVPRGEIAAVADLNADGQLDLAAIDGGGVVRMSGHGTRNYHWQTIRPRAQPTAGDQRINSFGVGADVEIRSGLLTERQIVTGPMVHFGLGTREGIDVVRIVWPNGILQADFDTRPDQTVAAEQRLKGSCPWVFAFDGQGMRFVTDFLWRSPLGLRINAQDTAGVTQTEDRVKIRGDQLAARNGRYDVRITAELWETHYIDHVSLMAVDHPADVAVFVDERFAQAAPTLAVHALRAVHPIPHAWDDHGLDVTDSVAHQDGRYLATFERGPYQGLAREHFVEVDVGQPVTADAHLWLVANGWIYPTDSSINVAIGQGDHPRPHGLALEARDASGTWRTIQSDLGFPAGKNKTILIDLSAVARTASGATRVRLRTNLEVYWDWLAVGTAAAAGDDPMLHQTRMPAFSADLRYRGFSKTDYARRDAPETPRYGELANVGQRWRDLVGYYTRFGDVRDLISRVDDRYVIMNAGDELALTFQAPAAPPAGWTRDFVLIGDGWVKDGDYNTTFSQTVLPLPEHGHPDYASRPAGSDLETDPVYRRHRDDWQTYHTRFVTPRRFLAGLR